MFTPTMLSHRRKEDMWSSVGRVLVAGASPKDLDPQTRTLEYGIISIIL